MNQHQDALLAVPEATVRTVTVPGVSQPVARVLLDSPLPHLDRLFDYLVPPELAAQAVPGTVVQVRFGDQQVHAWVWERAGTTTHPGRLSPIRRVVSDLPVLTEATRALVEAVASRSAGVRSDVVHLAVPARHARAERHERSSPAPQPSRHAAGTTTGWSAYQGGEQLVSALAGGGSPRAVWNALPGRPGLVEDWPVLIAQAVRACLSSGRGALVVVATQAQAEALARRLEEEIPAERVGLLCGEHGPERRYRQFVAAVLGHVRVVVGTRSAAYAPVADLGLCVLWDDADTRLSQPRAPYTHTRTVLALRCGTEGAGLLLAGYSTSVEAAGYVRTGWAVHVAAPRPLVRQVVARVEVPGAPELEREGASGRSRLPSLAHRLLRGGLEHGPVLVQVPRGGYASVLVCQTCRTAARCPRCSGPVGLGADGVVTCRWCGRQAAGWVCPQCGGRRVRMLAVGSVRTGEELGRAFPGVPVVVSGASAGHGVVASVDASRRLVVATPGAEPRADGGYHAVVLMDGAVLSSRPDLGAGTQALRSWSAAVALARPQARVMLLGRPDTVVAQALVRWDHLGFAGRELDERLELGMPPALRCARLDGDWAAVGSLVDQAQAQGWSVLGPVAAQAGPSGSGRNGRRLPADGEEGGHARAGTSGGGTVARARALIRVPLAQGHDLARWLGVQARRASARREPAVRVELDPIALW